MCKADAAQTLAVWAHTVYTLEWSAENVIVTASTTRNVLKSEPAKPDEIDGLNRQRKPAL